MRTTKSENYTDIDPISPDDLDSLPRLTKEHVCPCEALKAENKRLREALAEVELTLTALKGYI